MFCPKCRSEYGEGFTTCSDCNVPLVSELSPESEPDFIEYKEVLSTNSPSDRALISSILDAEGITYFFQGEYVSAYVYNAIPVRLMVKEDQVQKAIDILKDLDLSFTFGGLLSENEPDED
jgi:Putative prokaryotic signal transducing protein